MKNREMEFYRFLFAIVICLHHIRGFVTKGTGLSCFFGAGYLAVDLFFMVSGYFLAAHCEREQAAAGGAAPGEAALAYAAGRWKRLFPIQAWAWFVAGAVQIYLWKTVGWKEMFSDGFFELFMLEALGIGAGERANGPAWFCSALIIASFFVYYLLRRDKKTYLCVVVPLSCAVIFSYFANQYGHLNRWTQHPLLFCDGLFRGFAELGIGCACRAAVVRIKDGWSVPGLGRRWETALYSAGEALCLGAILYTMWKPQKFLLGEDVALEFICIPVIALFVIIVLSEKSVFHKLLDNRLSGFLGRLSLYVYLNHFIIEKTITRYLKGRNVGKVLVLYLAVVISYSIVTMLVFERLRARPRGENGA